MTRIFNKSIVSGTFSYELKISKVTPVYKTGTSWLTNKGAREACLQFGARESMSSVAQWSERLPFTSSLRVRTSARTFSMLLEPSALLI